MSELSYKEEQIADLRAAGLKPAQIAADVGTSVTTVYRILNLPRVKARISEGRAATLRPIYDGLRTLAAQAQQAVADVFTDPDAGHKLKLQAADLFYTKILAFHNVVDVLPALAALDATIGAAENPEAEDAPTEE